MLSPMLSMFLLTVLFVIDPIKTLESNSSELIEVYDHYKNWKKTRAEYVHLSRDYPLGWKNFHCDFPVERFSPKNIHSLAPWNVNVLASLGDSLSAGRAAEAKHLEDLLTNYPGVAFVAGGDKLITEEVTLRNIFNKFNPSLTASKVINVAKAGALSDDLQRQVVVLEKELRNSKVINFETDWKFINIFIGSNDLCKMCQNETFLNPNQYYNRLNESLHYIKKNIPRSFVNVMPPLSVQLLLDTHENQFCLDFHEEFCSCLISMNITDFTEEKQNFDSMIEKVVNDVGETDSFAAVAAPVIAKIDHLPSIGNLPNIAFPSLDCFHFSVMASDMVAKLLWRGLFQPARNKEKLTSFDFNPKLWDCPPPGCPFLRTAGNSAECSFEKVRYPSTPHINKTNK